MSQVTGGRLRRVAARALGSRTGPRNPPAPIVREPGAAPRRLLVAGHRGTCVGAPENTMAAFRRAAAAGVCAVEFDVQWTRATADEPSQMVVIHDRTLDRTTDGTGPVAEHTWSELRRLDAGRWYGSRWAGERLPRFEEVLAFVAGTSMRAFAELKVSQVSAEQAAAYVAAVRAAGMVGRTVASAFHTAVLAAVRDAGAGVVPTGIIEQANPRTDANVRARGTAYYPVTTAVTPDQVRSLRTSGVEVFGWPARSAADYEVAAALGLDGVTADDPVAALRWVGAH